MRDLLSGNKFFLLIFLTLFISTIIACSNGEDLSTEKTPIEKQMKDDSGYLTTQQEYENVQVLTDIPSPYLDRAMTTFRASLGVHCIHCHVLGTDGWDFPSDGKETKLIARGMIKMVKSINMEHFGGETRITCFTCHNGSTEPIETIPIPQPWAEFNRPVEKVEPTLPTVESVLANHKTKTGVTGANAIVNSFKLEGNFKDWKKWRDQDFELIFDSEDRYWLKKISLKEEPDTLTFGFDDKTAWTLSKEGVTRTAGRNVFAVRSVLNMIDYSEQLWSNTADLTVIREDSLNGIKVAVLLKVIDPKSWEEFYIASESGLLLKKIDYYDSPIGIISQYATYGDHRIANGILLAHQIRFEDGNPWSGGIYKFSSIDFGAPAEAIDYSPPSPIQESD